MSAVAKHSHICWLGDRFTAPYCNWNIFLISGESQVRSVCHNWTATVATHSCMPVCDAAHDSLFATTEKLQMPHTAVCQSLIQPMTVCHNWTATMPHTAVCQAVKLVDLCLWILFMWYQNRKASCLVVFRDKETFETTAAMLSRESRTNCLTWEVMWFYPIRHFLK